VIASAYNDGETVQSALEAGASGYLVKPVSDAQLEQALSAAMNSFEAGDLPPTLARG
jgi:YesN/AraC family two-component response regulator